MSAFGRRLQEKLRADKKAEILDRMRRKRQAAEERREKDEIAAQKQREARARRPVVLGRFGPFPDYDAPRRSRPRSRPRLVSQSVK